MFIVSVTFGTRKMQQYATVPDRETAEKLRECAIGNGFLGAKVYEGAEFQQVREQGGSDFGRVRTNGRGYVVVVTYGTRYRQPYATVQERKDAEKLAKTARELGYDDTEIVREADFNEEREARRRGQAHTAGLARAA